MPKLMDKKDWMQTVANVGASEGIWCENVSGAAGTVSIALPEGGRYQLILVKVTSNALDAEIPPRKSARDLIGYGRRFHPEYRSTAEIMSELREGESP